MNIRDLEILHEDSLLLAINKPSGLLSLADRTGIPGARELLEARYGELYAVHRLDKDTSGVLLFARTSDSHKYLSEHWHNESTQKIYHALIHGHPAIGLIDLPLRSRRTQRGYISEIHPNGKNSKTEVIHITPYGPYSLAEIKIHTGRLHQIRAHLQHIGHPMMTDPIYSSQPAFYLSRIKKKYRSQRGAEKPLLARASLHARQLSLTHPQDNSILNCTAPYPKDMKAVLSQLKKIFPSD